MLYDFYSRLRRFELEFQYQRRRERYAERMEGYSGPRTELEIVTAARERLRKRGWSLPARAAGEWHTFAFVPQMAWHPHLMPDLSELGSVTTYDYNAQGFNQAEFWRDTAAGRVRRREMNEQMVAAAVAAHRERSVDWMLFYGTGLDLRREALRELREVIGAPMVLMCLDDKQSWDLHQVDGQNGGQKDIAAEFDLYWTSARVCREWVLAEGGLPVYLPEGFNAAAYCPMEVKKDISISFVGARYGFRSGLVDFLRRHGVPVTAFGPGWENPGVWGEEQVRVFNRSRINLGHGGILHSEALTNVKTRDFEVPGTGGGAYVTSYSKDLASHFDVGREIFCFRDRWELVELLRELLREPERLAEAARRARERCLREHRWLHRYQSLLQILTGP